MKKLLLASLLLCLALSAESQVFVTGQPLEELHKGEYLVVQPNSYLEGKVSMKILADRLPDKKKWSTDHYITDSEGKETRFSSFTAGLNFLYENGWEIAFVLTPDSMSTSRFILKRRK